MGREAELAQFHAALQRVLQGERQVVFVLGEAGIGKTTVVDQFLHQIEASGALWLGQGQCIEHFGRGEAYLPILAALGQLGREPVGQRLREILQQYAPTWLVQLPGLVPDAELDTPQRKVAGATQVRMLRELAEALEVLTQDRGLILWFEDLQWSDVSTLEWLSYVAHRPQPARLLIVGTFRPIEVLADGHPLRAITHELHLHRYCQELRVPLLSGEHVAEYLVRRVGVGAVREPPHSHQANFSSVNASNN